MKKIRFITLLSLILLLTLFLTAAQAESQTVEKDGVIITMAYTAPEDSAAGQITGTLSATNTNAYAIGDMVLEQTVPTGYTLARGYTLQKTVSILGSSETTSLTVVFDPIPTPTPSPTPTATPTVTPISTPTVPPSVTSTPAPTATSTPQIPVTGDNAPLSLWLILLVVSILFAALLIPSFRQER